MKKIKYFNKKGLSLIELLGYIALIGLALSLLGNIFFQLIRNYDAINGRGAIQNEANNILFVIMNSSNTFTPDYVRYCDDEMQPCIELVKQVDIAIRDGFVEYVNVEQTRILELRESGDLYLGGLKLNGPEFKIDYEKSNISYQCGQEAGIGVCNEPIITIDLWIYRINSKGEAKTEPIQYFNQITL